MQEIQKKIVGFIESCMLLLLGGFGLWLSLSEQYVLLMSDKFRWLTFAGAVLILILGLVSVSKPAKRPIANTAFFALMLLIVLLGKPYIADENAINPEESFMQAGLWEQIDQTRFPKEELSNLSTLGANKIFESGQLFTTVGVVKRLEELDGQNSFALMGTFMYCCVADMFGTGFRVPTGDLDSLKDGQMVMISGKLVQEDKKIDLPNFRFGMAMISSTNKDYYLQAENIMTYNRQDQLPLLSELILEGERTQLFKEALLKSKLMDDLAKASPYTLFIPVDKAIEDLETPLNELSSRKLKKFLKTHMVKGKLFSTDLNKLEKLKSISGKELKIGFTNAKMKINQSRVLFNDTEAKNGVIHFIYPAISDE